MVILHTCLNVSDVERSVEWYVENLDFEESWGFETEDGETVNRYVDAAFEAIDHHGVRKEPADQPEAGARTAFVLDPDGHAVELIEPLEE